MVLASVIIPTGMMQANGNLNIHSVFTVSNNANVKELFIRLGGTGINGAMNSQLGDPEYGNSGGQFGEYSPNLYAGAVDMSVQQTLYITGKLGNAADTITLQSYEVEIVPKS